MNTADTTARAVAAYADVVRAHATAEAAFANATRADFARAYAHLAKLEVAVEARRRAVLAAKAA
jgi:hypothetical protein